MQVRVVACNPIAQLHASIINLGNLDSDQSTCATHFVKKGALIGRLEAGEASQYDGTIRR